jgi:glycerol uptake facilitator-like aquaporin
MSNQLALKLAAEFIGTFAFVFIGAGTAAVLGDGVGLPGIAAIALAHGLAIMAFAFAYGPVSGGHMNPAVTVGIPAAGAMDTITAIGYMLSQFAGASSARCCYASSWAAPRRDSARRRSHRTWYSGACLRRLLRKQASLSRRYLPSSW